MQVPVSEDGDVDGMSTVRGWRAAMGGGSGGGGGRSDMAVSPDRDIETADGERSSTRRGGAGGRGRGYR